MSADDPFDVEELLEAPYKKQDDNGDDQAESGSDYEHSRSKSHKKKHRHRRSDDEGSDRESRKRDRDRRRSRSRERHDSSRSHRGRDRDRDRDRGSYRDRDDDRRRDRDDDRRRGGDRDRDRDNRERGRSDRHSTRDRDHDQAKENEEEKRQERLRTRRELLKDAEVLTPEERDIRTVFCMQLAKGIREQDLEEFFSPAGTVVDVRLIADRNSRRSKGIAYVEFLTPDSLPRAISMTGQRVKSVPIIVQATQSEKNRLAAAAQTLQKPPGACRLYVGNLHPNINDDMINAVFTPFGTIESCKVQKDAHGESKSYAYVTFKTAESAKQAIDQLHGFELVGRPIKVMFGTEEANAQDPTTTLDVSRAAMMAKLAAAPSSALMPGTSMAPAAPGLFAGQLAAVASLGGATSLGATNLGALGLSSVGGLGMANLGLPAAGLASAGLASALAPSVPTPVTAPSPCFNLQNMFDPTTETDDGWQQEIMDDVLEEATKFGDVTHIHVDDKSPQGLVYVKCRDGAVAVNAMKSLHGRFFAGKQIIATPIPEFQYHTLFAAAVGAFTPIKPSR